MKTLFLLLHAILWICIIILAAMNLNDVSHINLISDQTTAFFAQKFNVTMPVFAIYIKSPILYLAMFILGECAGIAFLTPICKSCQEKLQAYKRELERGSITNSSSSSKIEVLENKIQVLEKALDDALKNK